MTSFKAISIHADKLIMPEDWVCMQAHSQEPQADQTPPKSWWGITSCCGMGYSATMLLC